MSDYNTKKCDGPACMAVKKEGNHWYKMIRAKGVILIADSEDEVRQWLADFEAEEFDHLVFEDLCSQPCATKAVQDFLHGPPGPARN